MKALLHNLQNIKYYFSRLISNYVTLRNDLAQIFNMDAAFYKKYEKNTFIQSLYFEVTNICNAKCVFCANRFKKDEKRGIMKFYIFKKALDEFIRLGGKKISFTPTIGDPLLDPGLIDKIKYAVNTNKLDYIYFYTNGIALNKNNLYKDLIDSGINSIRISTACFDKKKYEEVFGIGLYNDFLKGVHNLLRYNFSSKKKVKVTIQFRNPILPSKILSSPDFEKFIKPYLGEETNIKFTPYYDNWGGNIKKEDLKGIMKLKKLPKKQKFPCIRMFDAAILFDGSVRLCACRIKNTEFDELVVGNVLKDNLSDIFHNDQVKKMRSKFTENKLPPVCKNCSLYDPINKKIFKKTNKKIY